MLELLKITIKILIIYNKHKHIYRNIKAKETNNVYKLLYINMTTKLRDRRILIFRTNHDKNGVESDASIWFKYVFICTKPKTYYEDIFVFL